MVQSINFPPHNDERPIIWQPLRKKHHINLVCKLKSSGYHYTDIYDQFFISIKKQYKLITNKITNYTIQKQ
ncbi:hypothetical protein B6K85_07805 [Vibrio sp. V1B]|nr:hypothetical protein B6K85_07805 [Vibrio sp. V1B]